MIFTHATELNIVQTFSVLIFWTNYKLNSDVKLVNKITYNSINIHIISKVNAFKEKLVYKGLILAFTVTLRSHEVYNAKSNVYGNPVAVFHPTPYPWFRSQFHVREKMPCGLRPWVPVGPVGRRSWRHFSGVRWRFKSKTCQRTFLSMC